MSSDGAALMSAAVRAAILAKAPRRTVQAVAAAVAGALVHRQPAPRAQTAPREPAEVRASPPPMPSDASPEVLLEACREAREAKRNAKKVRRKANRHLRTGNDDAEHAGAVHSALASAGHRRSTGEASEASPRPGGEVLDMQNLTPSRVHPKKHRRVSLMGGDDARASTDRSSVSDRCSEAHTVFTNEDEDAEANAAAGSTAMELDLPRVPALPGAPADGPGASGRRRHRRRKRQQ